MKLIHEYFVDRIEDGLIVLFSEKPDEKGLKISAVPEASFPLSVKQNDCVQVFEDENGNPVYLLSEERKQENLKKLNAVQKTWKKSQEKSVAAFEAETAIERKKAARYAWEEKALADMFHPVDFEQAKKYDPKNPVKVTKEIEAKGLALVKGFLERADKISLSELSDEEKEEFDKLERETFPEFVPLWEAKNIQMNQELLSELMASEKREGTRMFQYHCYEDLKKRFITGESV